MNLKNLIAQYNQKQEKYYATFYPEEKSLCKIKLVLNTHPFLEPMMIFSLSIHEFIFNPRWEFSEVIGTDISKLIGKTVEEIINTEEKKKDEDN